MRTGRNNKNGGFSLVELIIVVAIMAIVVGVMGLSVGTLTGRKIAKCADEIVSTLERARVLTLGKEQNQVEFVLLQNSSTGEYRAQIYQGGTIVSDRIVGKEPITIQVYFDDDSTPYNLSQLKVHYLMRPQPTDCIWCSTEHRELLKRRPVLLQMRTRTIVRKL